jgi:hypothetical protein
VPYLALVESPTSSRPRIIFSDKDVPVPPMPGYAPPRAAPSGTGTGPAAANGTGAAGRRTPPRPLPHRVCARRGVVVGDKPFMVGGVAEANLLRDFAYRQVKVPEPDWRRLGPNPPQEVLVVDRGADAATGKPKPRGFVNPGAITGALRKYGVNYTYVTDAQLGKLDFVGQASLFARHGLLVMAHGAGESNALFLPARAAVIEVSPYGMWCPLYTRMAAYLGFHVFPLLSRLKGPNLDYLWQSSWTADWESRSAAMAAGCDVMDLPKAARGNCFTEYRRGSVYVPPHEFEHTLLRALDLIGNRQYPRDGSALALLDGEPLDGPGPVRYAPGLYANASAVVCPPRSTCMLAEGGAAGTGGSGRGVPPIAGGPAPHQDLL